MEIVRKILIAGLVAGNSAAFAAGLADSPLSLKGSVPPNVLFSLSVEFPTAVQAAYSGNYTTDTKYLGLFDSGKCYTYDGGNGWFAPASTTADRTCDGLKWSGNFLNWATMTGLDEFRLAMTGGNRYKDSADLTVLERTYIDTHGSTGYFPNKSYSGTGFSPYPSLTIVNAQKGIQMTATAGGTDTINCVTPSPTSPYCGSLQSAANADTVYGCSAWTGDGSSGAPYKCTTFTGLPAGATATPNTTQETLSNPASDTVNCSSPSYSGGFACTLTMAGTSQTGSCGTWSGSGASNDPFKCTSFGAFGTSSFVAAATTSPSSFISTETSSVPTRVPASGTTRYTCTVATVSGVLRATCNLGNGLTATSTSSSGSPRSFSSWSIPGGSFVSGPSAYTSGSKVSCGGKQCYTQYDIAYTYNASQTTNVTRYYVPSYTGARGTLFSYVKDYNLTYSGALTYNVRVLVCDSTVGIEANCKAYGSSYKPTGVLQDNGDKMRFGVFSYYNSNDIDNAVMRSKAKYVAPEKYSPGGGTQANANKEWSVADGTLIADPDPSERSASYPSGSNPTRSGVINYINQFGRPAVLPASTATTYKGYDPVGKLYYETLKYLRGLSPTTDFYKNAAAATNDDFPIITAWDDPILYSCQKNYIIVLGDKNTHCDKRLPGAGHTSFGGAQCGGQGGRETADQGSLAETVPTGRGPGVNVSTWTNKLGNLQGDNPQNGRANANAGAGGNGSWHMAGLAYWAASNDIRTDNDNQSSTMGVQKVKTYVIDVEEGGPSNSSQFAMAAKYGGAEGFDANGAPLNSTYGSTADHTGQAFPSYPWPKTLLRASDPEKMITSVRSALSDIAAQIGSESALAQSSGDLRIGNGAYIYRAIFNSGGWLGDVQAYRINSNGTISDTPNWKASDRLPAANARRILTYNDGLTATGTSESTSNARKGTLFDATNAADFADANGNFSSRQRAFLNVNDVGVADAKGYERMTFLRGDRSNEGASGLGFRARLSVLGDIINSNPTYVAAPIEGLVGNGYNTFANGIASRRPMIYVGGNDGMLHAFDASANSNGTATATSGKELLAYVPSSVYSKLTQLTSRNYSHRYFVDGSPVVSEACFANCDVGNAHDPLWKTVLVGGLNAGGQGIYALDVTNPDAFGTAEPASTVLWEFTDFDDADLGYTFGRPVIRQMNNGKWAAIFGNGYNNAEADGRSSTTGRAYLYVVFLTGPSGSGQTWLPGTDYIKVELKSPTEPGTLPDSNGLSSPVAIDVEKDGMVDYIYAGDVKGNIWKVDVSSATTSDWKSALQSADASPVGLPLFTATTSAGAAQKITTGLEITKHPKGGYMVMFGTGSYIFNADPLPPFTTDSYYGIWDKADGTRVLRSSLQRQKVLASTSASGTTYYFLSRCQPNYTTDIVASNQIPEPGNPADTRPAFCPADIAFTNSGQQRGWVLDLPASGERVVSEPLLWGGVLTFTTLTPASNPCTGNTEGMEYNVHYLTGGQSPSPVFDMNADGKINASDYLPVTLPGSDTTVSVDAAARKLDGASETLLRFRLRTPDEPPEDPASPTVTVCPDFIPGWGCPSRMGPPKSCDGRYKDTSTAQTLTGTGSEISGDVPKCINAPSGRLNWRQIMQ